MEEKVSLDGVSSRRDEQHQLFAPWWVGPTLVSMLLGAVPRSLTLAGEGGTTLRLGNLELGKNA